MRLLIRTAALLILALSGCAPTRTSPTTFAPPYPEHNANGDPILAVFEGRVPCAVEGCHVMKIGLVLYHTAVTNTPTTYWLGVIGVGKGNERTVTQGRWSVRQGTQEFPDAVVYALDANTEHDLRYYWRVNEHILLLLDPAMSPKVGNAAWGYMLSRHTAPYGPRTYR